MIRAFFAAAVIGVLVALAPTAAASNCYYPNCTAAHQAGEYNIPSTSPHYCASQDRDKDGYACEPAPH
jgi:hypothetical protein